MRYSTRCSTSPGVRIGAQKGALNGVMYHIRVRRGSREHHLLEGNRYRNRSKSLSKRFAFLTLKGDMLFWTLLLCALIINPPKTGTAPVVPPYGIHTSLHLITSSSHAVHLHPVGMYTLHRLMDARRGCASHAASNATQEVEWISWCKWVTQKGSPEPLERVTSPHDLPKKGGDPKRVVDRKRVV